MVGLIDGYAIQHEVTHVGVDILMVFEGQARTGDPEMGARFEPVSEG